MRSFASILVLLFSIALGRTVESPAPAATNTAGAVYDPDPKHLWNRLFVAFYRQQYDASSKSPFVGPDVVDPPLSLHPRFMLGDVPFAKCNAVLDEFMDQQGAGLIRDPLKRAMLQRDLWAVFDVLNRTPHRPFPMSISSVWTAARDWKGRSLLTKSEEQHRLILARKVAGVMRSLALSRGEIERLPDTYAAALDSGVFSDKFDPSRHNFLPHDLFATNSPWLEAPPTRGHQLQHTMMVGGRSVFRTFVKTPANTWSTTLPTAPVGTHFLLIREMVCLDDQWQMVPTRVVESIQIRTSYTDGKSLRRRALEVELSRGLLFDGKQGGLRVIPPGEPRIVFYNGLGRLGVNDRGDGPPMVPFPQNCTVCHGGNTLSSKTEKFSKAARSASVESLVPRVQEKLDDLQRQAVPVTEEKSAR